MRKKQKRKKCDQCGKLKYNVFKSQDPYQEEINNLTSLEDNPETWWCEECYQEAILGI
jgi:hypothetical protein